MKPFQVDLSNCDREPIHIPGKIQSHGFLLAYHLHTKQILYASSNIGQYTGIEASNALTKTITAFFDGQNQLSFTSAQFTALVTDIETGKKTEVFSKVPGLKSSFNLIAHLSDTEVVLEFEPVSADVSNLMLHDTLSEVLTPLQHSHSLTGVLQNIAWHIRNIIKYDRVMVYKYWEDWHGEVVAEEKRDDLEPFLGLHYPASDIPRQARELYLLNLVRIITNVDAQPADIVTAAANPIEKPLDLTHSHLRAVSPMHIQYLQNMGVQASFSISLVHNGKLWGLIACHNYAPRFIDYESRQACKLLAQLLSTMLTTKVDEEVVFTSNVYKEEADRIFDTLFATGDVAESLINDEHSVLKIGNAHGAALTYNGKVYTIGNTPTDTEILETIKWIKSNAPTPLYHTHTLPKFFSKASAFSKVASGVMAAELFKNTGEYILWFKPELNQTVKWAGNPEKPIEVDSSGATRLSPRQSFAVWFEEIKHTSDAWSNPEILTALRLREGVLQVISQKADDTRKLNERLKEAFDELDTFSYTISHDLRTPLSIIKTYTELLIEELPETPQEEVIKILKRIIHGADTMEALIKNVLAYSRLSSLEVTDSETLEMEPLLQDIIDTSNLKNAKNQKLIVQLGNCPTIKAPKVMVMQVFRNLIENAIKYSSTQVEPEVSVSGEQLENEIIYKISDNGIGIDATQGDKVFMLFKRLENATEFDGTGIGLATVKRLVKKLGGRVWFESAIQQGTTFYVSFPVN